MFKRVLIIFFIVIVGISAVTFWVKAGSGENVTGWLWGGSNTNLGWISTNNTNCDSNDDGLSDGAFGCPSNGTPLARYGLNIPSGNGNVTGYAWSENLGWINFDPIGPYPGSPNNSVMRVGNNLEGWARIVSIATADSINNSGGWKGWIKMNGTNYGVTISSTGDLSGYAWSDELGWIDFSKAKTAASPKYLSICNDCINNVNPLSNLIMSVNNNKNVKACLVDTQNTCLGTDVSATASWSSNNATIVSVLSGSLTSHNTEGQASIMSDYHYNGGHLTSNLLVTVKDPRTLIICENNNPITILNIGKDKTKSLKAYYNTSGNCDGTDVTLDSNTTWSVSPSGIVSLSPGANTEEVHADNEGNATITVQYKTKSKKLPVKVNVTPNDWKEVKP